MKLEEALIIIEDNFNSSNNSFLDFAHEKQTFEEIKFWEFYNSIRVISSSNKRKSLDRELTFKIMHSYEWFLILINFHFDKTDQCEFKNLPLNYTKYSLRLKEVIDCYLRGNSIDDKKEESLNEELLNPLFIKLRL